MTKEQIYKLNVLKKSMMSETREFMTRLRNKYVPGLSEHEFWVTFSFVMAVSAAYATVKMLPILRSREAESAQRKNALALFGAYLVMFADPPGMTLTMEDVLDAAERI